MGILLFGLRLAGGAKFYALKLKGVGTYTEEEMENIDSWGANAEDVHKRMIQLGMLCSHMRPFSRARLGERFRVDIEFVHAVLHHEDLRRIPLPWGFPGHTPLPADTPDFSQVLQVFPDRGRALDRGVPHEAMVWVEFVRFVHRTLRLPWIHKWMGQGGFKPDVHIRKTQWESIVFLILTCMTSVLRSALLDCLEEWTTWAWRNVGPLGMPVWHDDLATLCADNLNNRKLIACGDWRPFMHGHPLPDTWTPGSEGHKQEEGADEGEGEGGLHLLDDETNWNMGLAHHLAVCLVRLMPAKANGACLFDTPGVGKTISCLVSITAVRVNLIVNPILRATVRAREFVRRPIVIVCPSTVTVEWLRQIPLFTKCPRKKLLSVGNQTAKSFDTKFEINAKVLRDAQAQAMKGVRKKWDGFVAELGNMVSELFSMESTRDQDNPFLGFCNQFQTMSVDMDKLRGHDLSDVKQEDLPHACAMAIFAEDFSTFLSSRPSLPKAYRVRCSHLESVFWGWATILNDALPVWGSHHIVIMTQDVPKRWFKDPVPFTLAECSFLATIDSSTWSEPKPDTPAAMFMKGIFIIDESDSFHDPTYRRFAWTWTFTTRATWCILATGTPFHNTYTSVAAQLALIRLSEMAQSMHNLEKLAQHASSKKGSRGALRMRTEDDDPNSDLEVWRRLLMRAKTKDELGLEPLFIQEHRLTFAPIEAVMYGIVLHRILFAKPASATQPKSRGAMFTNLNRLRQAATHPLLMLDSLRLFELCRRLWKVHDHLIKNGAVAVARDLRHALVVLGMDDPPRAKADAGTLSPFQIQYWDLNTKLRTTHKLGVTNNALVTFVVWMHQRSTGTRSDASVFGQAKAYCETHGPLNASWILKTPTRKSAPGSTQLGKVKGKRKAVDDPRTAPKSVPTPAAGAGTTSGVSSEETRVLRTLVEGALVHTTKLAVGIVRLVGTEPTIRSELREFVVSNAKPNPRMFLAPYLPSTKQLEILRTIRERIGRGEPGKFIVFSNSLQFLFHFGTLLCAFDVNHVFIERSMTEGQRTEAIDAFQNDTTTKVFMSTFESGSTGINLTAADTVFVPDFWWNPEKHRQAQDRAHRIKQPRPVTVHNIEAVIPSPSSVSASASANVSAPPVPTIDRYIRDMHKHKLQAARYVVEGLEKLGVYTNDTIPPMPAGHMRAQFRKQFKALAAPESQAWIRGHVPPMAVGILELVCNM